jgi:bifunctional DNA-binding transcriptional regulator/antitoxin component of YhaV-PrlF toxin-antitoxin module
MSKVTQKLQVSIPKVLADAVGIRPGDDLVWENAGGVLRVYTEHDPVNRRGVLERLRLFDQATERQANREQSRSLEPATERGWSREDLYTR